MMCHQIICPKIKINVWKYYSNFELWTEKNWSSRLSARIKIIVSLVRRVKFRLINFLCV